MIAWPIVLAMVVLGIIGGVAAALAAATEDGAPRDPQFAQRCDRIGTAAFIILLCLAAGVVARL